MEWETMLNFMEKKKSGKRFKKGGMVILNNMFKKGHSGKLPFE